MIVGAYQDLQFGSFVPVHSYVIQPTPENVQKWLGLVTQPLPWQAVVEQQLADPSELAETLSEPRIRRRTETTAASTATITLKIAVRMIAFLGSIRTITKIVCVGAR